MVLDTSILIALLTLEAESIAFQARIDAAEERLVSAATLLETTIVYLRKSPKANSDAVMDLIASLAAEIVPVTDVQAQLACDAYTRFGKGRHPARLNFGDCFSDALAKSLNMPLLFKGDDFSQTDVQVA